MKLRILWLGVVTTGLLLASSCIIEPPTKTLTVHSTNPSAGVSIKYIGGQISLTRPLTKATPFEDSTFHEGDGATLTAPATEPTGNPFVSWSNCDSTSGTPATVCTVHFNGSAGQTVTANYGPPVVATKLAFTVQPSNTVAGAAIAPAVKVTVQDAGGNTFSSAAPITLAIGTNPSGGTLSGTVTVNAIGGVAVFSDLSIDQVGTGYTLTASSAGLTGASSNTFNVTAFIPTLTSIQVTPANLTIDEAAIASFTATGTFSDGSHGDVTLTATWFSSDPAVATITNGLGQGKEDGTTNITARIGTVISPPVSLTVLPPISIQVTSSRLLINPAQTSQFMAMATFSDGTQADVTSLASWHSTNTIVATITSPGGLVTGLQAGTTDITATVTVTSSPVTLTVNPPPIPRIAFDSNRNLDGSDNGSNSFPVNIWVMDANDPSPGANQTPVTKLTSTRASSFHPVWSPDGTQMVFQSARNLNGTDSGSTNFAQNIWVTNTNGTGQTALTTLTNASSNEAVWSPDGSQIAFLSSRALNGSDNANTAPNIWVMDANGDNQVPLTHYTFNAGMSQSAVDSPVWSPVKIGGKFKIAFNSRANFNGGDSANTNFAQNVWMVNADGSGGLTPVTSLTNANSFSPAWSPDASKIGYVSSRALDDNDILNTNSTTNIWVVNADGTGGSVHLTGLTAAGANSSSPAWSPDGSKIGYVSARKFDTTDNANTNNTANIWVMNAADGGSPSHLTSYTFSAGLAAVSFSPVWSPTMIGGKFKIAFVSRGKLDGTDNLNANSTTNIWLVNADGSAPAINLTSLTLSSTTSNPAWQP
jgi:Tol biopolymer transport system component